MSAEAGLRDDMLDADVEQLAALTIARLVERDRRRRRAALAELERELDVDAVAVVIIGPRKKRER